jgi:hypothetical protein
MSESDDIKSTPALHFAAASIEAHWVDSWNRREIYRYDPARDASSAGWPGRPNGVSPPKLFSFS